MKLVWLAAACMAVSACKEIPQDASKSFMRAETRSAPGAEEALAKRAQVQDEYVRIGGAKQ